MEIPRKSIVSVRPTGKRKRIRINVGGTVHETWNHTLERKQGTRLAALARNMDKDDSWDAERQEFFFDKHPGVFATVMHYYRSEELHTDYNICGTIIKAELEFWGLTELDIEPCCWGHYNRFKENKETLAALDDNFTMGNDDSDNAFGEKPTKYQQFKRRVWLFLEDPATSRGAKIYAVTSMFFVLLSITVFVLETHHIFREPRSGYNATTYTSSSGCSTTFSTPNTCCCRHNKNKNVPFSESDPHTAMVIMDYFCLAFFIIEFLARFYFVPKKCQFLKQPLNVIDILCLLPHFVAIIFRAVDPNDRSSQIIKLVLALRIIRVLRIFKLMKHYTAFKILVYTIKVSMRELFLMVIFLFTGVLIFASIMFYADNETFNNIPIGFWWALVTMTTVGYGDIVPSTEIGYVIGSMCVLCGVLVVAFTVPIVVNNFTLYYSHAQSRVRLPPTKREELQRKLIRKNQKAQEFIDKLTFNMKKTKAFNNLSTLQSDNKSSTLPSTTPRDTKIDTDAIVDRLKPKKDLHATVSNSTISTVVSTDSSTCTSPTIPTVSASIAELELELPGTPVSDTSADPPKTSITPQHIETVHLLNALEDQQEKSQAERQRQLDLIISRREERRQMRNSPRPAPAPAGNSRASMESVSIAGNNKKPPLPIQPFRPSNQNPDTNANKGLTSSVSVRIGKKKIT